MSAQVSLILIVCTFVCMSFCLSLPACVSLSHFPLLHPPTTPPAPLPPDPIPPPPPPRTHSLFAGRIGVFEFYGVCLALHLIFHREKKKKKKRERERERERDRERDRETERQRETETERDRDRETETERQRDRKKKKKHWTRKQQLSQTEYKSSNVSSYLPV